METSLFYKHNDALIQTKQPKHLSWNFFWSIQTVWKPWYTKSLENSVIESFLVGLMWKPGVLSFKIICCARILWAWRPLTTITGLVSSIFSSAGVESLKRMTISCKLDNLVWKVQAVCTENCWSATFWIGVKAMLSSVSLFLWLKLIMSTQLQRWRNSDGKGRVRWVGASCMQKGEIELSRNLSGYG